jgi:hypothetical protein
MTAGGCSRAEARYEQLPGQAISTSRLVPQQTAQICLPSAGQLRRARLDPHSGQVMCAVLYNPAETRENSSERRLHSPVVYVAWQALLL